MILQHTQKKLWQKLTKTVWQNIIYVSIQNEWRSALLVLIVLLPKDDKKCIMSLQMNLESIKKLNKLWSR